MDCKLEGLFLLWRNKPSVSQKESSWWSELIYVSGWLRATIPKWDDRNLTGRTMEAPGNHGASWCPKTTHPNAGKQFNQQQLVAGSVYMNVRWSVFLLGLLIIPMNIIPQVLYMEIYGMCLTILYPKHPPNVYHAWSGWYFKYVLFGTSFPPTGEGPRSYGKSHGASASIVLNRNQLATWAVFKTPVGWWLSGIVLPNISGIMIIQERGIPIDQPV